VATLQLRKPKTATAILLGVGIAANCFAQVELTEAENFSTGFEALEGYSPGYLQSDPVWNIDGSSYPLIGGFGVNDSYGLGLDQNAALSIDFTSVTASPVGWIDFYVKPAFGSSEDLPVSFPLGQAALTGFVSVGLDGAIYALHGDGLGNGAWIDTGYMVALDGSVAADWLRMTYRLDYATLSWDLFLNSQLQAIDLGFIDGNAPPLSAFSIQGASEGATLFDEFQAGFINPLYADADNDGMSDAYETAQGLDSASNDRTQDKDLDGLLNIEEFVAGYAAGSPDSDSDGVHDGAELASGTDPVVADSYVLTAVPYSEDFELLSQGDIHGTDQWEITSGTAQVSALSASSGSQSLELIGAGEVPADLQNRFEGTLNSSIWIDLKVQPVLFSENDQLTEAEIDEQAAVVFYFTEGEELVVFDGVLRQFTAFSVDWDESGWQRVTILQDYASQNWHIWCNGQLVGENLGFANTQPYFNRLKLLQQSETPGYLDDFTASWTKPLELDTDGDGLFDEVEDVNLDGVVDAGETDPFNSDTDDDGILDSIEPTFGLDPTVADSIVAKLIEQEPGNFTWETSFDFAEGYVESGLNSQNGWSAGVNALVSSEETAELTHDSTSSVYFEHLIGAGAIQKVWLSFKAKLVPGQMPDVATLGEDASAYWGFTNGGMVGVWDPLSQSWQEYESIADGEEWNEYAVYLDYDAGTWRICQNGVIVADNLSLADTRGLALARFRVQQEVLEEDDIAKTSAFNDIVVSTTEPLGLDFDGDGLPNEWERNEGFDPLDAMDAEVDGDEDGLTAIEEFLAGTNYQSKDSDGDGLEDGFEVSIGFDPLDESDATLDSDLDLIPDWWEIFYSLDRYNPADASLDSEGDGLGNLSEFSYQTDPTNYDSDGDGFIDGWEVSRSFNPALSSSKPVDNDHDGIFDSDEVLDETDSQDIESYEPRELYSNDFENTSFILIDQGDAPIDSSGMNQASGFVGSGVSGNGTNAVLSYSSVGNFSAEDGSVAFWYQPDWNSGDQISNDSDLLPWFGLVEVGEWQLKNTPAYVGVVVHRNTRQLGVVLHDGTRNSLGGKHVEYFTPISWKRGEWHHMVLTYEKDRLRFYVDSVLQFEKERPVFTGFANPIRIPARNTGVVDELKLYNYELSTDERELFIEVDTDNDALWDQFEYNSFGSLTVTDDLTGDYDGDGVNNRYESEARTNGNNADTDGDGLSDFDEILLEKGDPLLEDTDGDGILDGIEDSLIDFDVFSADTDGDGVGDYIEYTAAGEQLSLSSAEVVDSKDGIQTYTREGAWIEVEGQLCPVLERGRATYQMTVPEDGIYLLEVNAYQNNSVFSYVEYDLEQIREVTLSINGNVLGEVSFNHAYGHDDVERLYTQWLSAGTHQVELYFSEVLFSDPVFAINSLKLLKLPGVDANEDGVLDWQASLMSKENALEETDASFYSPVHLRGYSRILGDLPTSNSGVVEELWDNSWYLSLPLATDGSGTQVSLGFESGNYHLDHVVAWQPMNVLSFVPDTISIPSGTAVRFAVSNPLEPSAAKSLDLDSIPVSETSGYYEITFPTAGSYTVESSQGALSKSLTVNVRDDVQTVLNDPRRAREDQAFTLPAMHDGLAFEGPDRMEYVSTTLNTDGSGKLTLESFEAQDNKIAYSDQFASSAAPIVAKETLSFFDLETVQITYMRAIDQLEDGTLVVENKIMGYNLPANIKIVLDIFASGVTFEDGTTYREVTTADFDAFGVYTYNIWIPSGNSSAGCHRKKLYLGNTYLGNVNR
tara:strand:- start:22226 stop:27514 length:5289 start_codon:yes stop_codon:yes gene_type:complete